MKDEDISKALSWMALSAEVMKDSKSRSEHMKENIPTPEDMKTPPKSDSLSQEIGEIDEFISKMIGIVATNGSMGFIAKQEILDLFKTTMNRAENAEKELAHSQDGIRNLEAQVDAMAIQIMRIQQERDEALKSGTPYSKEIHEKNILTIQNQMLRAELRSLEERLKLAEKVVEAARDLSEFRSDKSLLRQCEDVVIAVEAYDSARASDNLQKKEDLSSTPTERLWCAACGVWGSHQSGTCPEIKK